MRRDLMIIAVLLIAAIGSLVWAHGEVKQAETDIRISENVIYGDPSIAEGLEVTMNSKLESNLYWSTTFWPGTDRKAESTFEFRDDSSVNLDRVVSPYDVNFTMYARKDNEASLYSGEVAFDRDEGYASSYYDTNMIRPVYELVQETGVADTKTKVFALSDYYEYYPINGDFSAGMYMQQDMDTRERLSEVFRIPIPENHLVEVTVTKDDEGKISFSMEPVNGEAAVYGMKYSYGMAEDGFYVLVHNQGIDCSEFADGYGIYKIPMTRGEMTSRMYLEEMHNFYPIDPEKTEVVGMDVDENGESLLLYTRQNENLCLTMIPLDDSGKDYTLVLEENTDYGEILEIFFGEGYVVLQLENRGIALITEEIQWEITTDEWLIMDPSFTVIEENDGKVVIVTSRRPENWNRIAYVTILGETGVLFEAEYTVTGDPFDTDKYDRYSDVILGSRNDGLTLQNKTPFTVNW